MLVEKLPKRLKMNDDECASNERTDSEKQNCISHKIQTFVETNRVEFDYSEGEGEIKVINWLANYKNNQRLILAKDNDVFIYVLSKYIDRTNEHDSTVESSSSPSSSSPSSSLSSLASSPLSLLISSQMRSTTMVKTPTTTLNIGRMTTIPR